VHEGNDGRYPDDSAVEVRYPRDKREEQGVDRAGWPWLPGSIVGQCGPDEWYVAVCERSLAVLEDGSPAPAGCRSPAVAGPGRRSRDHASLGRASH
jgi:hypothetical protein